MTEPIEPWQKLSPEEHARRVKLFKEQTSPLLREFLYNIADAKKRKEILEKAKNLKANLGTDEKKK
jgi:hypothetical protein